MKQELFSNGKNEYSKKHVFIENMLLIMQFAIGFIGMMSFQVNSIPYLSIAYALFAFIILGFFLRKHLCSHCFYYNKWCHCGWGKLSAMMYKKESGNKNLATKIIGPAWGILMALPILIMLLEIFLNKTTFTNIAIILFIYIIFVIINSAVHVCDCKKCKMRFNCPGSAAKKQTNA